MIDGLEAARDAAYAYEPRNEGEEPHVLFIRACLDDATLRSSMLDDIASGHDREMALRNAQDGLRAAEAAHAAPPAPAAPDAAGAALSPDGPDLVPDGGKTA